MGDPTYLEKLGRELKCPICLSLLSSAVSLTCNHVFCNSCIGKSMKSCSDCPVCKVPYRRREVRPVPHMDNLVSIYKSMEVASGVNIFVTQDAPSANLSDRFKQVEGGVNSAGKHTGVKDKIRAEDQATFEGQLQKISKLKLKKPDSVSVKPSCPTKKRVQVPQCPLSETPTRLVKECELDEHTNEEPQKCSQVLKDIAASNEKGEAVLSPFFWLRDDYKEKSTQQTDEDQHMVTETPTTPVTPPSFSDIKDSDDENPFGLAQTEEVDGRSKNVGELFDSEIFEWTQRPCSPELCPSPYKMQVKDFDGTQRKDLEVAMHVETNKKLTRKNKATKQKGKSSIVVLHSLSSLEASNVSERHTESNKRSKKSRNKREKSQSKCTYTPIELTPENNGLSKEVSENICRNQRSENDDGSLGTKRASKRSKKSHFSNIGTKSTPENISAVSYGAEIPGYGDDTIGTKFISSSGEKEGSFEAFTVKKTIKNCMKTRNSEGNDYLTRKTKKQKLDLAKNKMYEEQSMHRNQTNECSIPQCHLPFPVIAGTEKMECSTNSSSGPSGKQLVYNVEEGYANVHGKNAKSIQGNPCRLLGGTSQKLFPIANEIVLRRCKSVDDKISCDFCHLSEETEVSGEMIHYSNGRPVALDSNKHAKIIHSHWSCTEWAPNVYFEDDIVVNLEAEVRRSRRITCSCCGIKGASLGCYEKCCRKSFHVTCAKLTPQCRWDADNFVMLCPHHSDLKLPCESSGAQQGTKTCTPKRQSHIKHDEVATKDGANPMRSWNHQRLFKKVVLCCSSLTTADKETVSEFERLTGVTVLKKWDANVTHVIASTDESGACKRTLKVLMGILEGKWVLSIGWIRSCMQVMEPVDEESYEITFDIHGIKDGPKLGRLRVLNKQPKLFEGFEFFFMGDFLPSYKGYLQDLVVAAGGTILHRKPVPRNNNVLLSTSSSVRTFIIYSIELPDKCDISKKDIILSRRRLDAEAVARSSAAEVASNSWVVNSIAACKLQNVDE